LDFFSVNMQNNAAGDYEHISVRPLAGSLGAEIDGVDVRSLSDAEVAEIRKASLDHLVIFFRDQSLAPADLERFTRTFGDYGDDPFVTGLVDDGHPNVVRVLKEADEKHPFVFGGAWHSDWSFQDAPPSYTILYGKDVPEYGGDTLWANMYLAYESLSDGMKRILDGLEAIHSPERAYGPQALHNELLENMDIPYGEKAKILKAHPVVRTHRETGRKALFVNPGYTIGLRDMKPDESDPILESLYRVATNAAFLCRFRWEPGSLAVWDNRCTLHNPISDYHGQRREMYRTTVAGDVPVS
jgi:taurine dioxygenase